MKIHPTVWFLIIKNLIVIGLLYSLSGQTAVLWWVALTALLYSMFAVNGVLHLEKSSQVEADG